MRFGWTEILVVLAVILIFFGGKRLPELGRALGKSLRGFKDGVEGKEDARSENELEPSIQKLADRSKSDSVDRLASSATAASPGDGENSSHAPLSDNDDAAPNAQHRS